MKRPFYSTRVEDNLHWNWLIHSINLSQSEFVFHSNIQSRNYIFLTSQKWPNCQPGKIIEYSQHTHLKLEQGGFLSETGLTFKQTPSQWLRSSAFPQSIRPFRECCFFTLKFPVKIFYSRKYIQDHLIYWALSNHLCKRRQIE